jgi:hypothetical protein
MHSALPEAEASVGAARSLRAAQRAKRLDGRWSGGYFAAENVWLSRAFILLRFLTVYGSPNDTCGDAHVVLAIAGTVG